MLVPLLIGLNPSIALFCSGVGTIVYLLCTKAKHPSLSRFEFCFYHDDASFDEKLRLSCCRSGAHCARLSLCDRFFRSLASLAQVGSINYCLPCCCRYRSSLLSGYHFATTVANDAMLNNSNYDLKFFSVAIFTLLLTIGFNIFLRGFSKYDPRFAWDHRWVYLCCYDGDRGFYSRC